MTNIPLVILLGLISTLQTHLAKALERQGIEVFEQIKARLQGTGSQAPGGVKKPLIYTIGFALNHTVFLWAVLAQPYGPPALFSSMFGMGLVFLMIYAAVVLREPVTRREAAGAGLIVLGTLIIGAENVLRAGGDRFDMDLNAMFAVLAVWLVLGLTFLALASRSRRLDLIALAYGLFAGGLGSLDPFLKGVGQSHGGHPALLPSSLIGAILFGASFVIGFLAFLVTQFGFARKVRASLLVPAYNVSFITLPVILQAFLLPKYELFWSTPLALGLIIGGIVRMQPGRK